MNYSETDIPGVMILEPKVFRDSRGYFVETYNQQTFHELGIDTLFVQDNQSFTANKGTVRGIHFQNDPYAQDKIVRVLNGAVVDYAVDLRKGSPSYKKWVSVELSAENQKMFFIPKGFGHGFVTLTDDVVFCYKASNFYAPEFDRGIRYNDPDIAINWGEVREEFLSQKDKNNPLLKDSDCNFIYGK